MLKFTIKRILVAIPVLLGVTLLVFTMLYFTEGDPARLILGDTATEEEVEALREELGLNDSFGQQYISYLGGVLKGDLGVDYITGRPVSEEVMDRLTTTLKLAVASIVFSMIVAIPAGIISAVRQYSAVDNIAMVIALLGNSMPNFWLALMLILFFSVFLGILPASGLYGAQYYIMPVIGISAGSIATITRMTRSSMLEVIRQDYIRTSMAKGLTEFLIIVKHALKNALIPVITVIGIQFTVAVGGAVVNEQVFAIPGLGKFLVDAIKARNYQVVQGGVLVIAIICSIVNLVIDLLYAFVDPRIKSQYQKSGKIKRIRMVKEEG
ncbi:MAG: ABC transporter permease [Tissierellia bacterium]|nr:ABC transporter permease [Tissierellia bacterium]